MKTIIFSVSLFVAATIGSLWYVAYLAFGRASCTGVNSFAAMTLGIVGAIFIYLTFAMTDWINDWVAQKAVTKSANDQVLTSLRQMRDANAALGVTARATAAAAAAQRASGQGVAYTSGGLDFDDDAFAGLPLPPE